MIETAADWSESPWYQVPLMWYPKTSPTWSTSLETFTFALIPTPPMFGPHELRSPNRASAAHLRNWDRYTLENTPAPKHHCEFIANLEIDWGWNTTHIWKNNQTSCSSIAHNLPTMMSYLTTAVSPEVKKKKRSSCEIFQPDNKNIPGVLLLKHHRNHWRIRPLTINMYTLLFRHPECQGNVSRAESPSLFWPPSHNTWCKKLLLLLSGHSLWPTHMYTVTKSREVKRFH